MKIKVNDSHEYEYINVILDEHKFPIAHKNKVDELMEQGAFTDREEARQWVNTTPIELELYNGGLLFAKYKARLKTIKAEKGKLDRIIFEEVPIIKR